MVEEMQSETQRPFKLRYVLMFGALLLFLLALLSHDRSDLAILEGGVDAPLRNWVGVLGAHISRALLYLFGLASYPIAGLLIISIIRSFLPFPLKRPAGYVCALISVSLGIVILMAMWPQSFAVQTDLLGIGRFGAPELALSGGVIGAHLAAPEMQYLPAGLIRGLIGTVGTAVAAGVFMIPGLVFLFLADWKDLVMSGLRTGAKSLVRKAGYCRVDEQSDDTSYLGKSPSPEKKSVKEEEPPFHADPSPAPITNGMPAVPDVSVRKPVAVHYSESSESSSDASAAESGDGKDEYDEDSYRIAPPAPLPKGMGHHAGKVVHASVSTGVGDEENAPAVTLYSPEPPKASSGRIQRPKSSLQNFGDCSDYVLPPVSMLDKPKDAQNEDSEHIQRSRERLQSTLDSFQVDGRISEIVVGPRVTRFEVSLTSGVKVEKVTGLQNNIAMDLAAESIRILAPIPGKNTIGIEVPNKVSSMVFLRSLFESATWRESNKGIPIVLGRDIGGAVIVADLAKAPHLLIAGSTGSGKSVCMNTLIMSLLFRFSPAELRLILVDPKVVELEMYRPLPHLIAPVVNDPKKVPIALRWGVNEMERRYKILARVKAKNLGSFNGRQMESPPILDEEGHVIPASLPLLVIIIDELADIMMTEAKSDVETSICRIAQKGRAAGIHLVIATQTPRKDVVTGLIKANLPTKIAFKVGSNMDSRVILDSGGAEKLLGMGDMLFRPPGASGLERIQGSMVSDPEIQKVVDFVSGQVEQCFDTQVLAGEVEIKDGSGSQEDEDDDDDIETGIASSEFADSVAAKYLQKGDGDLVRRALEIVILENKVSTSYLQRRLGIGYNKSAEIVDLLEQRGIISGPLPGGQKREILVFDELEREE